MHTTQTTGQKKGKISQASLNYSTANNAGLHTYEVDKTIDEPFHLFPGKTTDQKPKFHHVKILLKPQKDLAQMLVSVTMNVDGRERRIIKDFLYDIRVAYTKTNYNKIDLGRSQLPILFNVGFAAATGGHNMTQIIRDVEINLLNAPKPQPDKGELHGYTDFNSADKKVDIKVFDNDLYPRGNPANLTFGYDNKYIDSYSFQFEDSLGHPLKDGTNSFQYTKEGEGIWKFNSNTRNVTFTLTKTDAKDGDTFTINYSAKGFNTSGGPFDQEDYRARTTPTTVTYHIKEVDFGLNTSKPNPYN